MVRRLRAGQTSALLGPGQTAVGQTGAGHTGVGMTGVGHIGVGQTGAGNSGFGQTGGQSGLGSLLPPGQPDPALTR